MHIRVLGTFLLLSNIICSGQNSALSAKLNPYFEKIPVLQSEDSIVSFLNKDTINYETQYYLDSTTLAIKEYDTYCYHFKKDTTYTHIFYRTESILNIDTSYYLTSFIGIDIYANSIFFAKLHYKKLKRKFSKYFKKSSSEKVYSAFTGANWETTWFYLNTEDKFPFMEIDWHSGACMINNGSHIFIYKYNEPFIKQKQ